MLHVLQILIAGSVACLQDVSLAEALGVPAAFPEHVDFATEVAAAEQRYAAEPVSAAPAAETLPAQVAQQAVSLASQQLPGAAGEAAGPGHTVAPSESDAAAAAAPLAPEPPGGMEVTGMHLVGGVADAAAAAQLARDAAAAVAAFQFAALRSAPNEGEAPRQHAAAAPAGAGAQQTPSSRRSLGLGRSLSFGGGGGGGAGRGDRQSDASAEALAAAVAAVRNAVVAALAEAFVERVPSGTASIARLQVKP